MASLNDRQRAFIVRRLAMFETPTEAAEAFEKEYGVEITRGQIAYYDPTRPNRRKELADKWEDLFHRQREAYLDEMERHAIAHKPFRVDQLNRFFRKAKRQGNLPLAAEFLKQAAKEVGGKYTDTRKLEHSGKGGGPIESVDLTELTTEQLHRFIAGEPLDEILDSE